MKKNLFVLLFTCLLTGLFAQTQQDFNLLTQVSLTQKWKNGFSTSLSTRAFFMENATELNSVFLEAGMTYKFAKNWKVGAYYRFRESRNARNFFEEQYRSYLDLAYSSPSWNNFSLNWRGRIQRQAYGHPIADGYKDAKYLIRNKFSLEYRYNWYWSGYVAEEIFTLPTDFSFPARRTSIGASYRSSIHHEFSAFFQQRQPTRFPRLTQWVLGLNYEWTL